MSTRILHLHSLTCTKCQHHRRYQSTVRNTAKTETNRCDECRADTRHTVAYLGVVVER